MAHPIRPFKIPRHDTSPALEGGAVFDATGNPLDFGTATVVFFMRPSGVPSVWAATGQATVLNASQLNASQINLRYEWQVGQTATAGEGQGRAGQPGYYEGQFEIRRGPSSFQSIPGEDSFIPIIVSPDIGG